MPDMTTTPLAEAKHLLAGDFPNRFKAVTIESGQDLTAGAVLGEVTREIGSPAADGGNTGDGTVTGEAMGAATKIGTYTLKCIAAAADGGTFKVLDPTGERLDDAEVGTAYDSEHLDFTINDGATDFVVGDTFTIAVSAPAAREYKLSASAAVDGSETPTLVLWEDVDASAGAVEAEALESGDLRSAELTIGTGHTVDSVRDALRPNSLFVR